MNAAHPIRKVLWIVLAGWAGMSGCTHNYYYTTPGCAPGAEAVSTQVGSVCDVPGGQVVAGSAVGGAGGVVVQQAPVRRTVNAAPNGSRVVISQPNYSAPIGRGGNRLSAWRRPSDPESVAVTRIDGTLDSTSPSVNR